MNDRRSTNYTNYGSQRHRGRTALYNVGRYDFNPELENRSFCKETHNMFRPFRCYSPEIVGQRQVVDDHRYEVPVEQFNIIYEQDRPALYDPNLRPIGQKNSLTMRDYIRD